MNKNFFMVDPSLGALRVDQLPKYQRQLRYKEPLGSITPAPGDRPVLDGKQGLAPNQLYNAANNRLTKYYLPAYQLAVRNGKPEVELRHVGADDTGEVGRMTLALIWRPPPAGRMFRPVPMDHVAELGLRYRIPVQGGGAAGENFVALQPLQQEGSLRATSTTIFAEKSQFDAVYQAMRDPARGAVLEIRITARVGVRTWQQVVVGDTTSQKAQAKVLAKRGALFTQVLNKESLATMSRLSTTTSRARLTVKQPAAEEAARVRLMQTVVAQPQRFSRLSTARVSVSPRPTARPAAARSRRVAARPAVTSSTVRLAAPAVRAARVVPTTSRGRVMTTATTARTGTVRVATASRITAPTARNTVTGIRPRPIVSTTTLSRVNAPRLIRAVEMSDMVVAGRRAVPVRIAIDPRGNPAIIDAELHNEQRLPFAFDPAKPDHDQIFATSGFDPGGIHLLLARQLVSPAGRTHTVYQDNLMRDVVHIAPAEYRLTRHPASPFLPGLSFLPGDFSTTDDEETEAEVMFQVAMAYELEPWIDPEVVELTRAELAREDLQARITPILPTEASLTLELDALGDAQRRTDATVETSVGITDALVLDHDAFIRLWRDQLSNPSTAISGSVDYRLFDGTAAKSDVTISLWQDSADLFDVQFVGPVEGQAGRYRILARNRIESPVIITKVPREVVAEGVVADAVDVSAIVGRRVEPQETLELAYQVTPADAVFATLEPMVLGRVEPDLNALLRLLMVSPGYSSLSFALVLRAADGTFGPPAASTEPLTGLLVEFDDGTSAELDAEQSETEVTLVGRLIDQILGTADDQQRYFYRVTNLHPSGEGARTGWQEGQGSDALTVGTAVVEVVELDF